MGREKGQTIYGQSAMRRKRKNLFDQKIFELIERKDREALQNMSVEESIKIMEELLDSGLVEECQRAKGKLEVEKIE